MIPFFTAPTFDYIFYILFYKTVNFSSFFFLMILSRIYTTPMGGTMYSSGGSLNPLS